MKAVIDMSVEEARIFFLEGISYCSVDLPRYFVFTILLAKIDKVLKDGETEEKTEEKTAIHKAIYKAIYNNAKDATGVNYKIYLNKDGALSWRQLQIIHPVLYVVLVRLITEDVAWEEITQRLKVFKNIANIECSSMPFKKEEDSKTQKRDTILNWWKEFEQKALESALEYECMIVTDIKDCYGSIYTHSIPWAIYGKAQAKDNRTKKDLVGNKIDALLRAMSYGQTNGIPQGSSLMDFIAELVLGAIDLELSSKITDITEYKILRFRDDYKIFTKKSSDANKILRLLSKELIDWGMALNSNKTKNSNNIIQDSIKPDKLFWITSKQQVGNIQKQLLLIHNLSILHPNSGSIVRALSSLKITKKRIKNQNITVLISIVVDIMYRNPKIYPTSCQTLSTLLKFIEDDNEKCVIIEKIINKFKDNPYTEFLDIWLQRVSLKFKDNFKDNFEGTLCKMVENKESEISLWNSEWLADTNLKRCMTETKIIDTNIRDNMSEIIDKDEVYLFTKNSYGGYY